MAVSGDGRFIAIGAYGRGSTGTVYTAPCSAGAACAPLRMFIPPDAQRYDQFGEALVLDGDGSLLFVGAPGRGGDAGVAYVLACAPATGDCETEYTLVAADTQPGERFGGCIGVSADEALAVGTNVGKLYYTLAPSAPATATRSATASLSATPTQSPTPGRSGGGSGDSTASGTPLSPGATAGIVLAAVAAVGGGFLAWLRWVRGWQPCRRGVQLPRGAGGRGSVAGLDSAYVAIGRA